MKALAKPATHGPDWCIRCQDTTAFYDTRAGCWACRCGWSDRLPLRKPTTRRHGVYDVEMEEEAE